MLGFTRLSTVQGKREEQNELFGKQFIVCRHTASSTGAFDTEMCQTRKS